MSTLIVGCGALGRRVGRRLVAAGEAVFGTTRSADRAGELAALGITPVVFDVAEGSTLPAVDRVVYCVGLDRGSGRSAAEVYVGGLGRVLGLLPRPAGRVVFTSTTGVYGQDDGGWVDEDSPAVPASESGRACLEAEGLVGDLGPGRGVSLRLAGLYGPGRMIRRAALERGEPIVGDPGRFLNLVHLDDAAAAVVAALGAATAGPRYVVADDRPVRRREYYELAARLLGAPPPRFVPGDAQAARDGANKRVSNRRMRDELGVRPIYPDITTGLPAALGPDVA